MAGVASSACLLAGGGAAMAADKSVAVVGDSISVGLCQALQEMDFSGRYAFDGFGKVSSGLINRDFFDWYAEGRRIASLGRHDTALILLGMNDDKPLKTDAGMVSPKDPGWIKAYAIRLYAFANIFKSAGMGVVIVGPPSARRHDLHLSMYAATVAAMYAAKAVGGGYIPTIRATSDGDGRYTDEVTVGGRRVRIRTDDGVHFTSEGYRYLAGVVSSVL